MFLFMLQYSCQSLSRFLFPFCEYNMHSIVQFYMQILMLLHEQVLIGSVLTLLSVGVIISNESRANALTAVLYVFLAWFIQKSFQWCCSAKQTWGVLMFRLCMSYAVVYEPNKFFADSLAVFYITAKPR